MVPEDVGDSEAVETKLVALLFVAGCRKIRQPFFYPVISGILGSAGSKRLVR